jgi:hypothetical protein
MDRRAKSALLIAGLALIVVEAAFIVKGRGHLMLLVSRRTRMEEATNLSNQGVLLSRRGEYARALPALEGAFRLASQDSLIAGNLETAYYNYGRDLIAKVSYQEALALAGRGLRILPENPALLCLKAEAHYRINQGDSALAIIGRIGRGQADLAVRQRLEWLEPLCRQERALEAGDSGNFEILFEGGEDRELASEILEMLEETRQRQGIQLGWFTRRPVTVVLYRGRDFSDITRLADWAGAAFDGKIRLPVGHSRDRTVLARVLTHEFIHALLFEVAGGGFPAWFNEGLAQHQEERPGGEARYLALAGLKESFMKLDRGSAVHAYQASHSAVEYLISQNGFEHLGLLLERMSRGGIFDRNFEEVYGLTVEEFDRKWRESLAGDANEES